jgi:ATP synthase protein I
VKNEGKRRFWQQLMKASTVPLNLVAAIFVGFAIGYGLDSLFGTSPYLTIVFLVFGIIAGFRELYRFVREQDNGSDKKDK